MKTHIKFMVTLAMVLGLGTVALSAQSCAAANHLSAAGRHSANASGELVAAGAESGAASVKVVSGVAAVPVFASGAIVASAGTVLNAVGESAVAAGTTTTQGAEKLWDFSTSDPTQRPALDRARAVPPARQTTVRHKAADPSPAEALKATR
ncbi:MAG TPA: hypothetical protein VEQ65_11520 [Opitutus sp.]|nr:hypothetical protein [Opitutus sp.]